MTSEISQWLIAQGPAGVIIVLLVYTVIFLFRKYDDARDEAAKMGKELAAALIMSTAAIEKANESNLTVVSALSTFKILSDRRSNQ